MPEQHRVKWFETCVAAIGVFVTGILGYGQWRLGDQQNQILENQRSSAEKRAIDDIEVRVMSLVSSHLGRLGEPGPEGDNARRVVLAAAEYLSNEHKRTSLASMADKIAEGKAAVSQRDQARLAEATQAPPDEAIWFSVLASLPGDAEEQAKDEANKKQILARDRLGPPFDAQVELYKTKISNNYAVVIGGRMDRAGAVALAARARAGGLATDAFAQRDRTWARIGTAPFE